eukprot:scaffold633_cov288-Ochromonas_danica.AAC.78
MGRWGRRRRGADYTRTAGAINLLEAINPWRRLEEEQAVVEAIEHGDPVNGQGEQLHAEAEEQETELATMRRHGSQEKAVEEDEMIATGRGREVRVIYSYDALDRLIKLRGCRRPLSFPPLAEYYCAGNAQPKSSSQS